MGPYSKGVIFLSLICFKAFLCAEIGTEAPQEDGENESPTSFKGHSVIEAIPMSEENLNFLRELDDTIPEDILDFWSLPTKPEDRVDILVHPDLLKPVTDTFDSKNLTYSIKVKDFEAVIQEERKQIESEAESGLDFRDPSNRLTFELFNYHKLDEIEQYLQAILSSRNDLEVDFDLKQAGITSEGRSIQYVSVASKDKSKKRAAIFMDCGIHAREWVSPAFCLYAIDRLLHPSNKDVSDRFDFYIMPVANPDGYVYTWSSNRMWRKNRRPSREFLNLKFRRQFWGQYPSGFPALGGAQAPGSGSSQQQGPGFSSKCVGTDPNRNFDIEFGASGSTNQPCQDTYHGEGPFTEPESKAIRDILQGLVQQYGADRVASYVSVHAYSQFWMTPHGFSKQRPKDYKDHQRVAAAAVNALSKLYQTQYTYGPINEVIYQASGSSVDWAYSKANIKYSFALELRDQGQNAFLLPVNQIRPTVEETWEGIHAMVFEMAKEYPTL